MRQNPFWLPAELADLISRFCTGVWGWPFLINVLIREFNNTCFSDPLTSQASFPGFAPTSGDRYFLLKF